MTRECAWCKQGLGEALPIDDPRITHGICPACSRAMLAPYGLRVDLPEDPISAVSVAGPRNFHHAHSLA
jgi:hypothetical protein